ncbi:hypothetical protein TNIN_205931, partial [Trichonephila inaurata madagascariensis]
MLCPFLEHCIRSEKEFPDLADDATLAAFQKDYDDLVSLKEHKMGELALFLSCPVLDCPDSQISSSNLNDHSKNNVKKHARKASQENKRSSNATPVPSDGFASPKKFAKKIKLTDSTTGPSQPITLENKFSNLVGEETKDNTPISNQAMVPNAPPKIPPIMFRHKKENYKSIIKDLNKDFPNSNVKLSGEYLKIYTSNSEEHRTMTAYLDEKREEFY